MFERSIPGDVSRNAHEIELIDELFSDVLWSVVVGFLSVGCMAISGEINDIAAVNNLFTAFSLALCCNFIVVTLMCLKRIDVCYQFISRFWGRKK